MKRVLVANRGEIAVRVIRACRTIGLQTVAIYSDADRAALPVRLADRAVCIGPARAAESYLNIGACSPPPGAPAPTPSTRVTGSSPRMRSSPKCCVEQGLTFVGPPADAIRRMGDKVGARELAVEARRAGGARAPTAPLESAGSVQAAADRIGYPVLLKAAAGGGGRGMRVVHEASGLRSGFEAAGAEAQAAFGDGGSTWSKYLEQPRHIEVQILARRARHVDPPGERDCSLQRRHQKLVEEAPAPGLDDRLRRDLAEAAVRLMARRPATAAPAPSSSWWTSRGTASTSSR